MKIGVFIGCFDPVHYSHLKIADSLTNQGIMDKIVIVPASNNYERKGLTDIEQRIFMLKLAFTRNFKVEICDKRFANDNVHTYQIMEALKKRYPFDDLYIIAGSDNLKEVETWRRAEVILESFKLITVSRNNEDLNLLIGGSSFLKRHAGNIFVFPIKIEAISSTQIRQNVQKGSMIDDLTTAEVVEHIRKYKLFK